MLAVISHDVTRTCLLLCRWLAVLRRMLRTGHLHYVANYRLQHRTDTRDEKNEAEPEMPWLCCEHVHQRSRATRATAFPR